MRRRRRKRRKTRRRRGGRRGRRIKRGRIAVAKAFLSLSFCVSSVHHPISERSRATTPFACGAGASVNLVAVAGAGSS